MSKEIKDMDFKELRNEVQMLRDELAIMQRKYEDILYNLDNENFSEQIIKEKNGMRTQIEINEEGIKTKVSNEDFNSAMTQTANLISTKVSSSEMWSAIDQTAAEIAMGVSRVITTKFELDEKPTANNTTIEQKGMLCEATYREGGKTVTKFFYWNNVSYEWIEAFSNVIQSQFKQTSDGFELTGDVSVKGKIVSIDESSYAQMSNTGFNLFVYNDDQNKYENKIGIGYTPGNYNYPYITIGAGTTGYGTDTSCIYKLGSGLWIGDASIIGTGGEFPGGKNGLSDISTTYPYATGVFIDLTNEEIHKYVCGVPTQFGGGEAVFG